MRNPRNDRRADSSSGRKRYEGTTENTSGMEDGGRRESYIQNIRDKAELWGLAGALAGTYERPKSRRPRGTGRWGTGCNMQIWTLRVLCRAISLNHLPFHLETLDSSLKVGVERGGRGEWGIQLILSRSKMSSALKKGVTCPPFYFAIFSSNAWPGYVNVRALT